MSRERNHPPAPDPSGDRALDDAFQRLRQDSAPPRPAFLEGLMADALAEMPVPAAPLPPRPPSGLRGVMAALGGWAGGATLAGAAAAGLAMGYFDPVALDAILNGSGAEASAVFDDPFGAVETEIGL